MTVLTDLFVELPHHGFMLCVRHDPLEEFVGVGGRRVDVAAARVLVRYQRGHIGGGVRRSRPGRGRVRGVLVSVHGLRSERSTAHKSARHSPLGVVAGQQSQSQSPFQFVTSTP